MSENVWKLLLQADDRILESVEADIKKLDELASRISKIPPITATSNVRQVIAQDSAAIDALKAKAQAGVHIGGLNSTVSPLQEAAMQQLYGARVGSGGQGGIMAASPWDRIAGRMIPGFNLGASIGGALGGGAGLGALAGGAGLTMLYGAIAALAKASVSIVRDAQERDLAVKREMTQIQAYLEVSKGSTEALGKFGNAIETIGLIAKKSLGEILGTGASLLQGAAGAVALGVGSAVGSTRLVNAGDSLLTTAYADLFLGGTGASDAVAAESRLSPAAKARKSNRGSIAEALHSPEALMGIPIDEMARRGLFVGSSAGQSTQELIRQGNSKLDSIRETLARLPSGIAESL